MTKKKWTIHKLAYEMRRAGWVKMPGHAYVYTFGNRVFSFREFDGDEQREQWHKWAEAGLTPPPF